MWPTTAKLRALWSERRNPDLLWTGEVSKCAGTQAVMDLYTAFTFWTAVESIWTQ